jgi:hypothetical protein
VSLQQSFNQSSKAVISGTGAIEMGGALGRGQGKDSLEDGFFWVGWIIHGHIKVLPDSAQSAKENDQESEKSLVALRVPRGLGQQMA